MPGYIIAKRHSKTAQSALDFLTRLKTIVPYPITKILTDNGIEFTDVATHKGAPSGCHMFDQFCKQEEIEHRLTKPYHPWPMGRWSA
jgi:transposase InsO family protein